MISWFEWLCIFAALTVAAVVAALPSPAHSMSWYDASCCNNFDCEPLPAEAVEDVSGGWHVHYLAKRGFAVDVFVPTGKDRPSQDGRFHGCATPIRFLCLYVPRVS